MIDYKLEHVCSYTATLANPPEVIGPVAEGIRANFLCYGWRSNRLWLNRLHCLGIDELNAAGTRVSYDVYAVR